MFEGVHCEFENFFGVAGATIEHSMYDRQQHSSLSTKESPVSIDDTNPSKPRRPRGRPRKTKAEIAAEAKHGKPKITERQRRILDVINDSISLRGYPPSIREIAEAVGLSSTSSVSYQLEALQKKGYLHREDNKPRAVNIRKLSDAETAHQSRAHRAKPRGSSKTTDNIIHAQFGDTSPEEHTPPVSYVPAVGSIAAGNPILAEQNIEEYFPLPPQLVGTGELFMLEVKGDSMIDARIYDGDWIVVRSQNQADFGDIVAAMIDGEATVKEFRRNDDGLWLWPHNTEKAYEPFPAENATILGKVTAVLRKI